MKRQLSLIAFAALLLAALGSSLRANAYDKKFFKRAAENVWSAHPELFDPTKEVPDSLARDNSAVILSCYTCIVGEYHQQATGNLLESRINRISFTRKMVKLLDQNAVEEFSKHEFGESAKAQVHYLTLMEAKNAFGARVHKPDGRVVDVDLDESFAISDGKKHRKKNALKHKIDIPGLEVGDVIDYFDYDEIAVAELDPPALRFQWLDEYPIMDYLMECRFAPEITVEYRSYNDAPALEASTDEKGRHWLKQRCINIPVLHDRHYLRKERQLPFYTFYTLNNTSDHRFYPRSKRPGGTRGNLLGATIYYDILYALAASKYGDAPLPGQVKKIVKRYKELHPDASKKDILEAAWTAAVYVNNTKKKGRDEDYWVSVMFNDLALKEKWADTIGIAFINSRLDVPTHEIVNWRQPDFGIYADGNFYCEASSVNLAPGELLSDYQGEEGAAFLGSREEYRTTTTPHIIRGQASKMRKNRADIGCTLTLDPDRNILCDYTLKLAGTTKEYALDLTSGKEWIEDVEEYLGIEPGKRQEFKNFDPVERASQIEDATYDLIEENLIKGDFDTPTQIKIASHGIVPASPNFEMTFKSGVKDAVSDAGNSMVVSIGRFFGNHPTIDKAEHERQTDIFFGSAHQNFFKVRLDVPDGYEVDAASLEKLNREFKNQIGLLYVQASVDEGGDLLVESCDRFNYPAVTLDAWPQVIEFNDAKNAFSDAVVVLNKK